MKTNARRKRRAALNLADRDAVLRGDGRRSPVPALKDENESLESINYQKTKHTPPVSSSKTSISDIFAAESNVL